MGEALALTVGRDEQQRMLAIISRGGHPQIEMAQDCEVLDVKIVRNMKEAKAWYRQMRVERPWQTRQ